MVKPLDRSSVRRFGKGLLSGELFAAGVIYAVLGGYLYQAYLGQMERLEYLVVVNSVVGAIGCFVLSRRWVSVFAASLFAGAVYGFSPFSLSFAAYHPLAGVPMAALPWMFLPAVVVGRQDRHSFLSAAKTVGLSALPLVGVGVFFWVCAHNWRGAFFPLPQSAKIGLVNFAALALPLAGKAHEFAFGFYHVPLAGLAMGVFIYFASGRTYMIVMAAAGLVLAICNFDLGLGVPSVVWMLVCVLFCSILIGTGMQGLSWAGSSDRQWILACGVLAAVLALAAVAMGERYSAGMFGVTGVLAGSLFFMSKAQARWHLLRWILLCAGFGVDIVIGAGHIIGQIF